MVSFDAQKLAQYEEEKLFHPFFRVRSDQFHSAAMDDIFSVTTKTVEELNEHLTTTHMVFDGAGAPWYEITGATRGWFKKIQTPNSLQPYADEIIGEIVWRNNHTSQTQDGRDEQYILFALRTLKALEQQGAAKIDWEQIKDILPDHNLITFRPERDTLDESFEYYLKKFLDQHRDIYRKQIQAVLGQDLGLDSRFPTPEQLWDIVESINTNKVQ